ncbi:hypothetical protein ACFFX0_19445 [Citricoccus parietis]|uniref:Uncharacterized protein n=1 Tax=Citricoccus parietis TaxID=592307 RepID=A0ABV5G2T8_9MICC
MAIGPGWAMLPSPSGADDIRHGAGSHLHVLADQIRRQTVPSGP